MTSDATSRIPLVDLDDPGPAGDALRSIAELRGRAATFHRLFANSPAVLESIWSLVTSLWESDALGRQGVELLILRVSVVTDAPYEWVHHVPMARRTGLTDEQIAAVADWEASSVFDDAQRALLAAADELLTARRIGEETMARLERQWSPAAIVEVITTVGLYALIAGMLRSSNAPYEEWAPLDDPLQFPAP